MTGPDSVRHRTVRDYSKVRNERKRPLARAWRGCHGNLGRAAARYHTGNPCGVDCDVCVFADGDCVLVRLRMVSEGTTQEIA